MDGPSRARPLAGSPDPEVDGLAALLAARAGDVRGLRFLDAGCGGGTLARALEAAGARVAALDPDEAAILGVPVPGRLRGDAGRLPFRDAAFDAAACSLVLHYIQEPGRCLSELRRVLRPGGRLLLADRILGDEPAGAALQTRFERLRNPRLARLLNSRDLEAALRDSGFTPDGRSETTLRRSLASWTSRSADPARLLAELSRLESRDLGGIRFDDGTVALRVLVLSAIRR